MCLTAEAMAMFLNLLSMDIIETQPDTITIHAQVADTVWVAVGDDWCTGSEAERATRKALILDDSLSQPL